MKKTTRKTATKKKATAAPIRKGKTDRWMTAKRVRVRRVKGQTLVDIER